MNSSQRQTFTDGQAVEIYQYGVWATGIVETGDESSPYGDYQFAGGYEVAVWCRGERVWRRNDRRLIRPQKEHADADA